LALPDAALVFLASACPFVSGQARADTSNSSLVSLLLE
jgi:hypothetical protein